MLNTIQLLPTYHHDTGKKQLRQKFIEKRKFREFSKEYASKTKKITTEKQSSLIRGCLKRKRFKPFAVFHWIL